jgi:menaquinone-dependent protoporphyrinogen oxidase
MTYNLLVYDTKYGSTEIIARWISEEMKDIEVKKAQEIKSIKDYQFIIIGSPNYDDEPLKSISQFIEKFKEDLKEKKIAIFVVCNDLEEIEYKGKKVGGKYSLEILRNRLPTENIVLEEVFGGVLNAKILDDEDQDKVAKSFSGIGRVIKKEDLIFMPIMNKLDLGKCKEFAEKLNNL